MDISGYIQNERFGIKTEFNQLVMAIFLFFSQIVFRCNSTKDTQSQNKIICFNIQITQQNKTDIDKTKTELVRRTINKTTRIYGYSCKGM